MNFSRIRSAMSHTVTVTRTTTTSTTSAIILNTGYLKTLPGLLKLAQVILGGIILGILVYYRDRGVYFYHESSLLFLICIVTTFFIASLCLLLSCLCSITTASIISKTLYEFIYHGAGFLLYLAACLMFFIEVNRTSNTGSSYNQPFLTASILGLIVTALYLVSSVIAYRSYRGG